MKFMPSVRFHAIALLILNAVCSTCASAQQVKAGDLVIDHAWARATPAGAKVGGGFLTIDNKGTTPDKLMGASSRAAGKVEVHETAINNGVATMRPVKDGLSIPAGQSVTLAPGGYHLMMMELKGPLKKGDKLVVTLVFEKAGEVKATFDIQGIGATGPTSGQMDHAMPGMQQPMKMNSDHKM
jgi:periplasmic copper chaperone A